MNSATVYKPQELNYSDPNSSDNKDDLLLLGDKEEKAEEEEERFAFSSVLSYEPGESGREQLSDQPKRDGLSGIHVFAYSVGHLNNDLCAAIWFNYLTYYVNKVVGLTD